ncbi:MAG TPA: hypothetical protein VFY44_06390, partial [Thermoleophilaceae bacterium]|nr:hypothetical protein [Thermoleophilaceae bacterium]
MSVLGCLGLPSAASAQSSAPTAGPNARYALANGCFALRSSAAGKVVAKSGGGYAATSPQVPGAEPFTLKATALGSYMLYGPARDYLARDGAGNVAPARDSGPGADWTITVQGNSFRLALGDQVLSIDGAGRLVLTGSPGPGSQFSMEKASGCAAFPEVETGVTGAPSKGSTPYTETAGFLEAHMHGMAFEFLGGRAHCGRPWHRYGVEKALVDCPDHELARGGAALVENQLSYKTPARSHDPVGWPTFKDWPAAKSLTHEQSYYKWLERSWRAGQRVFVNLLVENAVLCEVYPFKQNSCDEMDAVRLQARRMREMENYIDAQAGGPGKGFYRIVTDPYQARRVVNEGKMAIVMGIEVSEPFGCRVYNDAPQCDRAGIDRQLDEVYRLGVRQMELINKFDNALAGVAGDTADTGVIVNNGNKLRTGKYWAMGPCDGAPDEVDRQQVGLYDHDHNDLLSNAIESLLPLGVAPVYPRNSNCNARGLTELGEHVIRRMMAKRMIVDPDHLSVRARKSVMSLLEAKRYSGVVSSHSWSTPDVVPRIYNLGGVITPYAGDSKSFVKKYREEAPKANRKKFYFGFGFGADMNGFGAQGNPRNGPNPVTYPFKSWDGKQTIDRQKSGTRVFDINKDGVAHYGLYPDWIEDLRKQAGDGIVRDLARGSEAYLQMWERAEGVRNQACRSARGQFTAKGMGRQRLGAGPASVLQKAGQ